MVGLAEHVSLAEKLFVCKQRNCEF